MPNIVRFLGVLIALVVLSPHSYAQTADKQQEGITSVSIVLAGPEGPQGDVRACGVTKENLRSAASFPVATSRLGISDASPINLSIRVAVMQITPGNACAGTFGVRVYGDQFVAVVGTDLLKFVRVELWQKNGLLVWDKGGFSGKIREAIERYTKEFVVDWTLDQQ